MPIYALDANQRCSYKRDNEQHGEVAVRIPDFTNRGSGVLTGLRVTTGPGLSLNVAVGRAIVNHTFQSKTSTSAVSGVNTNFNFVVITGAGTISNVTGVSNFPASFTPLAMAHASGGSFKALRDLRVRIGSVYLLSPGLATAWVLTVATGGVLVTTSL